MRGTLSPWARDDMFDVDAQLRTMDQKGIDIRVLSLSTPSVYVFPKSRQPEVARNINDVLANLFERHPDQFIGFATLPLGDVQASLTELERAIHELGMKGIAIGSNIDGVQTR